MRRAAISLTVLWMLALFAGSASAQHFSFRVGSPAIGGHHGAPHHGYVGHHDYGYRSSFYGHGGVPVIMYPRHPYDYRAYYGVGHGHGHGHGCRCSSCSGCGNYRSGWGISFRF